MDIKSLEKEASQDRKIDPDALDVECVQQADLFCKWAERAVVAKVRLEKKEYEMKMLEARLQMDCRENPSKFGLSAVTEKAVASAVLASKVYFQAMEEYFIMQRESLLLSKVVDAMDQKKRMIQELVTLHGQQYFAGPTVPRNLGKIYHQHFEGKQSDIVRRQSEKMKNRREE